MKKIPYIVTMVMLIGLYLLGRYCMADYINTEVISTILAIVAAVAFWMEYKSNERVNEAQLIMELNDQFVTNPQFSRVEWELEKYYDAYIKAKAKGEDTEELTLGLNLDILCKERQYMVNYLVHLEGIAALVSEEILHLKVISNLMAYRYFIAVNNPVVQQTELYPFKEYYGGIFRLYEKWCQEFGEENVPMAENCLVHRDGQGVRQKKR